MDEIIAALRTLGYKVWDTDATGADLKLDSLPYLLVLGSSGEASRERTYCDRDAVDEITVRHVGATRQQVEALAARTSRILDRSRLTGTGWIVDVVRTCVRAAAHDPEVKIPGTSQHPIFLDHVYQAWTQKTR